MESLDFINYEHLAEYIYELVDDKYRNVYTVLFYEDAKELLKELLLFDDADITDIDLHDSCHDGYDKEYYVYFNNEHEVGVEIAYHEADEYHNQPKYYTFGDEETVALIDHRANSAVIKAAADADCFEIEILDCEDECKECECSCDCDIYDEYRMFKIKQKVNDIISEYMN